MYCAASQMERALTDLENNYTLLINTVINVHKLENVITV